MSKPPRDARLLALGLGLFLLFAALAVLSIYLLVGESRRSRILTEYEADRLATALAESLASQTLGASPKELDERILGFGLYGKDGELVAGLGDAPASVERPSPRSAFSYDEANRRLVLVRGLGVGGMPGPFMRAMRQRMGMGMGKNGRSAGFLYLSVDISDYYRRRALLRAATIAAPLAVAGLAACFLGLLASNLRYRKRAEEKETLARLGESARTLAHEVRNPLGAIRIQTALLRQKFGSDGEAQLEVIDEETERLNALSRKASDFLRDPRGDPRRVELGPFLEELARRSPYAPSYSSEGASSAGGTSAHIDPELLRQAIDNLLRNAGEAMAAQEGTTSATDGRGGGCIELALSVERPVRRCRAIIEVRDRGPGIGSEKMSKVFDPFFTDKEGGSGMGLPLARRYVEAAGGRLTLVDREGGGLVARVELPAECA
jgi:Signal transduction histidine kinase